MFDKETAEYYADNAKKLHGMIDGILYRYRFPCTDKDDFYSIGNQTFAKIVKTYDRLENFHSFLYNALSNQLKKEITRRNALKRTADRYAVSIDMPITEDGLTIGDTLASDYRVEDEVMERYYKEENPNVESYLNGLSTTQRQIVELKMDGRSTAEIMAELNITKKKYNIAWGAITSFEKTLALYRDDRTNMEDDKMEEINNTQQTQTKEKSKSGRLSVASIAKKIKKRLIRFDHPLQRQSEQWTRIKQSNLISDILQGNPVLELIMAEQVIGNISIIWNLDGKQRCTTAYSFTEDGFKISQNVTRYEIKYQTPVMKEGKEVFDENKNPVYEEKTCDIRGKRFSQLPEELQDSILDYNFTITQYINCTSEDIAYHIKRYNEGKPMSVAQRGLIRLGEQFASIVKSIGEKPFFRNYGEYKTSEFRNGTIDRIISESVMAINYIDDWKNKTENMCEYICENCTESDFDDFESLVDKLTEVIKDSETACEMFTSKNTFLWFGLFERFQKLGLEDREYIRFLENFHEIKSKKFNGVSYDEIDRSRSTKDKTVVVKKMKQLVTMMNDYFNADSAKCA